MSDKHMIDQETQNQPVDKSLTKKKRGDHLKQFHWKPGKSANPGGKVKGIFSEEALKAIASHYLDEMPREQLIALILDENARNQLSTAHDIVLTRISEALRRDSEGRLNADWVMDRLIGKPKQTDEMKLEANINNAYTLGVDAAALESMMRRYLSKKDRLLIDQEKANGDA